MNMKVFELMLCVFLSLSVAVLSGCERMRDIGMTDEMVAPSDTDTMPTLKVGVIRPYPLYFSFGEAAELAQFEINQAGGVLGMQVEFIYREELTEDVVQSATELIEKENVVAILGPLFSSHAVKVGPVATVPVLLGATGANVTETGDFLFLVASSNALQAKLMAQFAVNELGAETAAMIWQNEDVYSMGFVEAFDANFQELGGSIVAAEVYESGDTVFETQLTTIQAAAPDVLFLASFPPANPLIMKQARDMGIESIFIGSDGMDDSLMFEVLDDNAPLENTYYCTNFDPDATAFISAYEAVFENPANGIAASGYDAMKILAIAVEAAGSTDSVAIRDAIAAITDYKGATSISRFDENRHPDKSVGVFQILNGQTQPYKVVGTETAFEISGAE
jgi:branched-chain amino acid transport system substrate-binding protein